MEERKFNVKLRLEEIINHEIGILNISIVKKSEFCFNLESINDTLDLVVKQVKEFIMNKLIKKK